ncbi:ferredoxin [Shimia abyssi]|uniref:4Fe-4S ferredoxin-type domain-containing protein n=1 Tax=Shimia abyssi TaxID=1662395 RepID=A0A2P8F9S7_9RHOB|nr:ferredoxin [Shimia abyssi]PSL18487.1 hypothetical protein CLV88_11066 [Shimia abyssi]
MNYDLILRASAAQNLDILGGFHPNGDRDPALTGVGTLLLLGPREPGFWDAFSETPEYRDGTPNPMDRWSSRVITGLATAFNAHPFFPFGGPPYQPFFQWAVRSGRCHPSPISLLVHDTAGLFVSFRGALAFPQQIEIPQPPENPCNSCVGKPCTTACPVDAFASDQYRIDACRTFLAQRDGADCMSQGCAARRACPVSARYGRLPAQSAFHMRAFQSNGP